MVTKVSCVDLVVLAAVPSVRASRGLRLGWRRLALLLRLLLLRCLRRLLLLRRLRRWQASGYGLCLSDLPF